MDKLRLTIELERTDAGWQARCLETGDTESGRGPYRALSWLAGLLQERLLWGEPGCQPIPQRNCATCTHSGYWWVEGQPLTYHCARWPGRGLEAGFSCSEWQVKEVTR